MLSDVVAHVTSMDFWNLHAVEPPTTELGRQLCMSFTSRRSTLQGKHPCDLIRTVSSAQASQLLYLATATTLESTVVRTVTTSACFYMGSV
jgi:hypothetical protein